jgi:penicillin-binding protein 1C
VLEPTTQQRPSSTLRRLWKRGLRAAAVVVAVAVVGVAGFVCSPVDEGALAVSDSVQVLAKDGTLLATGRNAEGARQRPLPPEEPVPPLVAGAFVAVEDRRFVDHVGVDVKGVLRAVKDSLKAGRVVSGASTLTQQLARRLGHRRPGLVGKVQEGLWALRLERSFDKRALLRAYLNHVPLGRNTVGVEAAASTFFGTSAALLTPAQAALLAGMAHAPEREDPLKHPASARARRDDVLSRMRRAGVIDDDVYARAVVDALPDRVFGAGGLAPHLATRLREGVVDAHTVAVRPKGAAVVRTTLDARLQRELEALVHAEVVESPLREQGLAHAAIVVLDNDSGAVLAWVGSADFDDDATLGKNDGVLARRQPGSALKPFVYAAALGPREQATPLTAASVLYDIDLAFDVDDGGTWTPQNYDHRMHGPVSVRVALQNSYNVPAVQVARRLGARAVLDVLHGAGFASLDQPAAHYGVGLVLGNGEVTLLELANAYRGLANGGVMRPVVVVASAVDASGTAVDGVGGVGVGAAAGARFVDEGAAHLIAHILKDTGARALAFGLDNTLELPFDVAAKTGTSRSYVDNWTAGFTRERTVAVWAGSFDGTPMEGVSGIAGAGVIFRRAMEAAMRGIEPAPLVDDDTFAHARVCPLSGARAGPTCSGVDEVFLPGTAPPAACSWHKPDGSVAWPRELVAWAEREGLPTSTTTRGLVSPRNGDVFWREPGTPWDGVPLSVRGVARVTVDGRDVDVGGGWVDVDGGVHVVVAYDADGHVVDEARFTVR